MKKEVVSDKQGIALIVLFIVGSSSIFAQGIEAKKDLWLAFILGVIMVLPMLGIFARLHYIFPGKDLFYIIEACFGKLIGKIMIMLYIWFVYFMASDILVNYGQFINIVSFEKTPQIVVIGFLGILCIWAIKEGIENLGRISVVFMFIVIFTILILILFLIPKMEINNLRPVFSQGFKPILDGAFSVFTFPLIQIVVFTMAFSNFKKKKSSYRIYIIGLLIGASYLALLSITNILVLGVNTTITTVYPSHATLSKINIANTLQRIEVVVITIFILGGFIKISILLLCACKGVSKLFKFRDYRFIIIPISLLTINLSYFQYESVMYYFEFNRDIWPYYNFPFQVIFPIAIWIVAEIKKRKLRS
ncbi:GerAB/ArcD/ProY family transporter [Paramaledivibacter caminithermalis]|uniref:Spore germination protein KB n=1 Tax=Paramaledivibacter caminithermalis (strain DSM 15212 / CIP 107654 / DViRD3) TaxID=1121301 RepID=A0A1M6JRW5_PARC5|nr:endospore germination permease [Paramaledivibacter caminithermalis]SHJ49448.1 spore germination protein KB [Paramaledivibacter caminithermalis DSM 15212]